MIQHTNNKHTRLSNITQFLVPIIDKEKYLDSESDLSTLKAAAHNRSKTALDDGTTFTSVDSIQAKKRLE